MLFRVWTADSGTDWMALFPPFAIWMHGWNTSHTLFKVTLFADDCIIYSWCWPILRSWYAIRLNYQPKPSCYTMPNTKLVELIINDNDIQLINISALCTWKASSWVMDLWMDLCMLEYSINPTSTSPQSNVYRAVVILSLLYGCESWTLYQRDIKQLEKFHIHTICSIFDIYWQGLSPT